MEHMKNLIYLDLSHSKLDTDSALYIMNFLNN